MRIATLGIDIGKTAYHMIVWMIAMRSFIAAAFLSNATLTVHRQSSALPDRHGSRGSPHDLARCLREQGHQPRIMPAHYVRPFVKTNKNDHRDAEAIAEAVQRPSMRFVPLKEVDQQDLQLVHRIVPG